MRRRSVTVLAVLSAVAVACSSAGDEAATSATSRDRSGATADGPVAAPEGATVATVVPADGNRWVEGTVDVAVAPVVVDVGGDLRSLVGAPTADGATLWLATRATGDVVAFTLSGGVVTEVTAFSEVQVTPDAPPVLVVADGAWQVLALPDDASTISSPVPLGNDRVAYVTRSGGLGVGSIEGAAVAVTDDGIAELDLLRDTRLSQADDGSLSALAGPTEEYGHGVIGDAIEARSVARIEVSGASATLASTVAVRDVTDGLVVEGTSVILADVDGDGVAERLVTVSGPDGGAQVVALTEEGEVVAGDAVGQGGRWRHVIGVLPGPEGPEVVEVVTPHLGRRLQFLSASDGRLEVLAAADGVSASHTIGSRDLDQAVLVDVAGVGPAYVGPSVDRTSLIVAHRSDGRIEVARTVALGAGWATNLASIVGADGATALGVGLDDGRVLVWAARA